MGTRASAQSANSTLRLRRAAGLETGPRLGRRRLSPAEERTALEAARGRLALEAAEEAAAERARLAPLRKKQAAADRDRATRIYGMEPRGPEPLPHEEHRCQDGDCVICRIRL